MERFLEIILISLSWYFAYHGGKDLRRDLEGIWTYLGMICNGFLNDFGGRVCMMTGSAYNAMDVLCTCESLLIG